MIRSCLVATGTTVALLTFAYPVFADLSGYDVSSVYDGNGGVARGFLSRESSVRVDGEACGWSYEFSPTEVFEGNFAEVTFHSMNRITRYDRGEQLIFLGALVDSVDEEGAPPSCYDGFRHFIFHELESVFPIRRRFFGVVGPKMVFSGENGFVMDLDFPPSEWVPLSVVAARLGRLVLWLQDPDAKGSISFP